MRVKPITEEQATESAKPNYLLRPGECDFEVKQAQDQTSDAGNEMIKLTLDVWDSTGKKATVYDYLLDAIPHKVRHAAYACGIGHVYERGEIEASHFEGKNGRLVIRTKEQPGYNPKNDVTDYVIAGRTKKTAGYQGAKANDSAAGVPTSPRRQAWEDFQKKNTGKNADEMSDLWRAELAGYFGNKTQDQLTDVEWRNFMQRDKQQVTNPIGDGSEFKEDDIPF
jgi:hypothetical protein